MSMSTFKKVRDLEDISPRMWRAFATKVGSQVKSLELVDVVKGVIAETVIVSAEVMPHLSKLTRVSIGRGTINPRKFFKKNEMGLWTSKNFRDSILSSAADEDVSANVTTVGYSDLSESSHNVEIDIDVPEYSIFEDVDTLLVRLVTLIESQKDGEKGVLLSNGHPNIFYVKVADNTLVVHLDWSERGARWRLYSYRLVDARWNIGDRVFSAVVL